jgi:hypothetical protein
MNIRLSSIAIVAGDAQLAEAISAHFRAPRVYVVVIEQPTVRLEEYGIFENDCITVANAIKAHHPQIVLFVSCSPKVAEKIGAHLSPIDAVDVNAYDPDSLCRFAGFRSHSVDVEMTYLRPPRGRHIIAVENDEPMSLVIARNLAAASTAEVFLLPYVTDEQRDLTRDRVPSWAEETGFAKDEAKRDVLGFIIS